MLSKLKKNDFQVYGTGVLHKLFNSHDVILPEYVEKAAGMLSKNERKMLYYLASEFYKGNGAIIDGGSFFGSSLVSSAAGLSCNPILENINYQSFPDNKPIHGFELGFLPAPQNPKMDKKRKFGDVDYTLGESFVPILKKTISPYNKLIEIKIGDILEENWPDKPIEICFIDVCKTAALNRHASKQFYPNLIESKSFLINQDFFFDRLPWIKVTMGYLEDYFEWYGQVATSSIYRNIKAIPKEIANFDPYTECSLDECIKLHDKLPMPFLERRFKFFMELSKSYLIALKGTKDNALNYIETIENEYDDILDDENSDRGNNFRLKRAKRQISNGMIHKVS